MNEHDFMALKESVDRETAANRAEHEAYERRLKALESGAKERTDILLAIQRQGDVIENMGKKIGEIAVSVGNVEKRVDEIEKEPAENWKKMGFEIAKCIVLAVVGVAVGYFLK